MKGQNKKKPASTRQKSSNKDLAGNKEENIKEPKHINKINPCGIIPGIIFDDSPINTRNTFIRKRSEISNEELFESPEKNIIDKKEMFCIHESYNTKRIDIIKDDLDKMRLNFNSELSEKTIQKNIEKLILSELIEILEYDQEEFDMEEFLSTGALLNTNIQVEFNIPLKELYKMNSAKVSFQVKYSKTKKPNFSNIKKEETKNLKKIKQNKKVDGKIIDDHINDSDISNLD